MEKLLNGKHYNNCMRIYKYIFDALMRLKLQTFEDWLSERSEKQSFDSCLASKEMQDLLNEVSEEHLNNFVNENRQLLNRIEKYEEYLESQTTSPTATFWQSFLQMMNTLFAFVRSVRTGDWPLHVISTQRMLPWLFAYDRPNYARYLTYYWAEMQSLEEKHPVIYQEFL